MPVSSGRDDALHEVVGDHCCQADVCLTTAWESRLSVDRERESHLPQGPLAPGIEHATAPARLGRVRRGAKNVMMSGPLAPYQHHVSGRSTVRRFQVGTWKTYGARSNEVVAATLI